MKKVNIGGKPTAKSAPNSPDDWVSNRPRPDEPIKRLTIDIPLSLHQRVKSQCALKGENMADTVRELLEKHFGPENHQEATSNHPETTIQKHDSVTFRNDDSDQPGN